MEIQKNLNRWGAYFLAFILIISAGKKSFDFWDFLQTVSAYHIVPISMVPFVSVMVLLGESVAGIFLMIPAVRGIGAAISGVLFATFLEASFWAGKIGYHGACGCFPGVEWKATGYLHVFFLIFLLTGSILVFMTDGSNRLNFLSSRRSIGWLVALVVFVTLFITFVLHHKKSQPSSSEIEAQQPGRENSLAKMTTLTGENLPVFRTKVYQAISTETDSHLTFFMPRTVRFLPPDRLFVLDSFNHRIVIIDTLGHFLKEIGGAGKGPGELKNPWSLDVAPDGRVYVIDGSNNRICIFGPDGEFERSFPFSGSMEAIAVDSRGRIYLNEPQKGKLISVYQNTGEFLTAFGEPLEYKKPAPPIPGAANTVVFDIDGNDNLWLAFQLHPEPELRKYDSTYTLRLRFRLELPVVRQELKTYKERASGTVFPRFAESLYVDHRNTVWVLFNYGSAIYNFDSSGEPLKVILPYNPDTGTYLLGGMAIWQGRLWATDIAQNRLLVFVLKNITL